MKKKPENYTNTQMSVFTVSQIHPLIAAISLCYISALYRHSHVMEDVFIYRYTYLHKSLALIEWKPAFNEWHSESPECSFYLLVCIYHRWVKWKIGWHFYHLFTFTMWLNKWNKTRAI